MHQNNSVPTRRALKMKFVLMFLMSVLVTTHQYFHDQPRQMPWSPYSPQSYIGKYQPYMFYYFGSNPPALLQNQNFNRIVTVADDSRKDLENEQSDDLPDTESRVKGISLDRLPLNDQANGRFLFNLFSSSGTYTNSFFKTATFTVYSSVSLTSFVNCVPSTQMLNGAAATACRRKRSGSDNTSIPLVINERESDAFSIAPSETLKMVPTVLLQPSSPRIHQLSSSKEDVNPNEMRGDSDSRKGRFFFLDKNQLVVSTTVTSFAFVNTTITVTRSLLTPAQAVLGNQCVAAAAAAVPQCIACLPAGYIVCPAAG